MLYHLEDPKFWVNQGYRYAAATTAAMDKSYKETRSSTPPGHTAWGALENTAGGALALACEPWPLGADFLPDRPQVVDALV